MLKRAGLDYLQTESLNQDPLDSTFGVIHLHCDSTNNPTVGQYVDALKSGIISGFAYTVMRNANCEGDDTEILDDLHSLLKESSASRPNPSTSHGSEAIHDGLGGSHVAEQVENNIDMELFSVAYVSTFIARHVLCAVRCDDCK
jgi:hypothetical protein